VAVSFLSKEMRGAGHGARGGKRPCVIDSARYGKICNVVVSWPALVLVPLLFASLVLTAFSALQFGSVFSVNLGESSAGLSLRNTSRPSLDITWLWAASVPYTFHYTPIVIPRFRLFLLLILSFVFRKL
jgi:hypothetical protein